MSTELTKITALNFASQKLLPTLLEIWGSFVRASRRLETDRDWQQPGDVDWMNFQPLFKCHFVKILSDAASYLGSCPCEGRLGASGAALSRVWY